MTKNTFELRSGEVVVRHGMRLLLGERKQYEGVMGGQVVRFDATILNVDEVNADGVVPFGWRCETRKDGDEWAVQGNELANWWVEGVK